MTTNDVTHIEKYVYSQLDHLYDTLKQDARSDPRVEELKWVLAELKGWDGTATPSAKLNAWLERNATEFENGTLISAESGESESESESKSEPLITPPPIAVKALPARTTGSHDVLEVAIAQIESDDSEAWRDAILTLQALKERAEGEKQIGLDQWLRRAQRQHQQEIERLYERARAEQDRNRQRQLYNRILKFSFAPDKERANDLLTAIEKHERQKEEAEAKRRLLGRIVDRLETPRGRAVTTKELHDLLNDIKRLFSEEEQHGDEELATQIKRVQDAYNALREEEGEITTRANLGQHAEALKKLDDLVNQGITQLPLQDGNLIDIGVRRRNIVNDYRTFVHNKIAEKRGIADNEWLPANPVQALSVLEESKALYEALVQDVGGSTPEDRQLESDLGLHMQRVGIQIQSLRKAEGLIQKANEERNLRKKLTYLRQAQVEYDQHSTLSGLIARAEERLANQVAAEIENELKKIEREAQLTNDSNKISRLQGSVEQLSRKGIADGVTSTDLQEALQKREAVQNYLMARADFLQRVKEIRSALQQQPLALSLVQQKVEMLITRYPEETYPNFAPEIKQLQVQVNSLGDDEQKLLAAEQALELGDPDEALKILEEVKSAKATPLRKQARISQKLRQAAAARLQGKFKESQAYYDEIERLPNLDPETKAQVQKERAQAKIEEQNQDRLHQKKKLAQQFWEKGHRARACQELKEATNIAGAGAEIRNLLDHYLEQWRLKALEELRGWLVQDSQEGWQEIQTLVKQARDNQLLLNDDDRKLADEVYLKCRHIWALEAPIPGDEEQAKEQLDKLERLVEEVPALASDLRYLYRVGEISLFLAKYDKAKEYVRKYLKQLGALALNPSASQQTNQRKAEEKVQKLKQEIATSMDIHKIRLSVEQRLEGHRQVDGFVVRDLHRIQARLSSLQTANLTLQNDLDELIERTVDQLIQQGKEKHEIALSAEVLSNYYWAWSLLNPQQKKDKKSKRSKEAQTYQFKRNEVQEILDRCSDELPRVIQTHLAKIEQFESDLSSEYQSMAMGKAREQVKPLKEQTEALHKVLQQIKSERVRPADKRTVDSKRNELIDKENNLVTLEQKITNTRENYDVALKEGDINTERLFGPIEEQLRQIQKGCKEHNIQLKEVADLERELYHDIGERVLLPLAKNARYRQGDASRGQPKIVQPVLGQAWPQEYQLRAVTIGDTQLHKIVVRLIEQLQDAWLDEEFDFFYNLYSQFLYKIDKDDRYTLQTKADLYEYSYDGTNQTIKYDNLTDAHSRVEKKIENLQAWQAIQKHRAAQQAEIKQGWEKIRDQTRASTQESKASVAPNSAQTSSLNDLDYFGDDMFESETDELPTLERRQALIKSLYGRVTTILKEDLVTQGIVNQVPTDALSDQAAKLKEETEKAEKEIAHHKQLVSQRARGLQEALQKRKVLLDKLHDRTKMEAGESTEILLQELKEIDPMHPTVQILLESGGIIPEEPKPETPWWKFW